MKSLSCRCGQAVFFDNHRCGHCGREVAFDPTRLVMRAESEPGAGLPVCANRTAEAACNWLAESGSVCLSCRTSRVIPDLSKTENRMRWRKLEGAKRRLIVDLLSLGLPVDPAQLEFVFKEDRRTNPNVHEEHVAIGHYDGVITINAAEADEVYREEMRQVLNEPIRTLLGHFRHESGHYYFDLVVGEDLREEARALFGDERADYDQALAAYYRDGAPADWAERHISAYAAAHPVEDWAECWSHYLQIRDVQETAQARGLHDPGPPERWQASFVTLAMGVNELMRSMGLPHAYPFLINPEVGRKLDFIHAAVGRFTTPRRALSAEATR